MGRSPQNTHSRCIRFSASAALSRPKERPGSLIQTPPTQSRPILEGFIFHDSFSIDDGSTADSCGNQGHAKLESLRRSHRSKLHRESDGTAIGESRGPSGGCRRTSATIRYRSTEIQENRIRHRVTAARKKQSRQADRPLPDQGFARSQHPGRFAANPSFGVVPGMEFCFAFGHELPGLL